MKLTPIDHAFIRLVGPDQADALVAALDGRSERLNNICRMLPRSRGSLLRDWAKLVVQGMRGVLRASPAGRRRVVFWDRVPEEHDQCRAWLRRFLGDVDPFGISMQSRIVRGMGFGRTVRLLAGLGMLLLRSDLATSDLASSYVLIARTCLLAGSHARSAKAEEAYLFLIYRPENAFIAAWLMRQGIHVHQVALTTPLLPFTRAVVGDDLVLCNPFQLDEMRVLEREREWPPYELWAPKDFIELETLFGDRERPHLPNVIAMYTQGFRLRVRRGLDLPETGVPQAEHEELLGRTLLEYVETHPEVTLRVFPHPMERRAYLETGEHDLGALVGHERVEIDWEGRSSVTQFEQVGLGIMGYSTVGFDRVFMNFPTIFFMPTWLVDERIESTWRQIFVSDPTELVAAIDRARPLTPAQFMDEYFGGPFRAPDHAEVAR